jgi:hypothetical protein
MRSAGLTKSGIEKMHRILSGHSEWKYVLGLAAQVGRHDDAHTEVLGTMFPDGSASTLRSDGVMQTRDGFAGVKCGA